MGGGGEGIVCGAIDVRTYRHTRKKQHTNAETRTRPRGQQRRGEPFAGEEHAEARLSFQGAAQELLGRLLGLLLGLGGWPGGGVAVVVADVVCGGAGVRRFDLKARNPYHVNTRTTLYIYV